jgi:hypothetical protein
MDGRTALLFAALSFAACSNDGNTLLDSGPPPEDVAPDEPKPDAPVAMDAPDASVDVPVAMDARDVADSADVADRADATDARDVTDVLDAADALDARPDVADVPTEPVGCGALAMCAGRCVDLMTTAAHCGSCDRDCTALVGVDAARVRCVAGACVVTGACATGRGDCDANPATGCETDLTAPATCGACATRCAEPTPLCAAGACTSGCSGATPTRCGTTCVNLQTAVAHCGACNTACPAPASATATCAAGRCGFTCNAGTHLCAGACASNTSVMTCGAACSPCATRPNTVVSCDGMACRYACTAGFDDCDGNTANGCERPVADDVANCGRCGNVCSGADTECRRRTCAAGVCGVANTAAGTRTTAQTPRDCRLGVCDGSGALTTRTDDTDLPVDGNACTDDVCAAGVASNPPTAAGRACGMAGMQCNGAGLCVECVRGSDCASGVCMAGRCAMAMCTDGIRNGTETGIDCGGSCPVCPVLVMLGGGSASTVAASYDVTAGLWSPSTLSARTVDGVSIAVTRTGEAVGLLRHTQLGDPMDNRLRFTVWRAGVWSPFADIGPTVTTQGAPAVVAAPGGGVWALFHGFDFSHYFAAYDLSVWSPPAETTGASGARAGALLRNGLNPVMVFSRGLPNELYARERVGTWGGDQLLDAPAGFDVNVSPTAVNLTDNTLGAAWVAPGGQVRAAFRSGGAWRAPVDVPMCLASGRVALARVSDAQLALAFRGTDGNLYVTVSGGTSFMAPTRVAMGITGSPAIARGVGAATLEAVFVVGGVAQHARLIGGTWTAPTPIGGTGLGAVAVASGP